MFGLILAWSPGAPPPSAPTLLSAGLFLTRPSSLLFLSQLLHSVKPFLKYGFTEAPPYLGAGLSCALWQVGWKQLEPAVSSTGQPQPLLIEALQPLLPAAGHLHSLQMCNLLKAYRPFFKKKTKQLESVKTLAACQYIYPILCSQSSDNRYNNLKA